MGMNVNLANVSAYAEALYALVQGPSTVQEITRESGLAANTTRKFVASLKRRGLIRVAAWEQDSQGRYVIAAYEWGSKPDAKRPPRLTNAERRIRHYAKLQRLAILRGTAVKHTRVKQREMPQMRSMDGSP